MEMTDKGSNLLWFGIYTGWDRLKEETRVTELFTSPFACKASIVTARWARYDLFRYYEPDAGRFVN